MKHKNAKKCIQCETISECLSGFFSDAENPQTVKTCLEQKEEKFD